MNRAARLSWILAMGVFASTAVVQAQEREREERDYMARVVKIKKLGGGFLGVELTPLTPELRVHFGVAEDTGVMVARVAQGGPAEAAGIRVGDILTAIDGERVESSRQLARAVRKKQDGDVVAIDLYRDGSLQSYTVTVTERDRQVVDLAGGYSFMPGMDELPDHDVVIRTPQFQLDEEDMRALEGALEGLGEHFDGFDWQEKIERLEGLDISTIEERMKEVERRLKELEKELEKEDQKDL